MPPLKSSAAFHEQTRTDDFLKRKFRSQPEQSELVRMCILAETSAETSLLASHLQLKRARLADDLNTKVSQQLGPMELIHKSILPVHSSFKQAIIETQFTKPSCDDLSADMGSNDSASSEQSSSQPRGLGPLSFPSETLPGSTIPSPTQVSSLPSHHTPRLGSFSSPKLNSGTVAAAQRISTSSQMKPKANTDRSAQRHKKPVDHGPKIKKLKYHQYIAPNQKEDKEPLPHLDSSYSKILQQQQLYLQLQILRQQQQNYSYNPVPCAPPRPQKDQLSEMKVADLKSELKLRRLPVYGTKNDLIERLRTHKELSGGSDTTSSPTAGGTTVPGAKGARKSTKTAAAVTNTTSQGSLQCHQTSSLTRQSADDTSLPAISVIPCASNSPEDSSFNSSPVGQMLSFQLCSTAQLSTDIKEDPPFSTPASCQVSLKPASLQEHCPVSSTTHISTTTAPVLTIDKDKMLQEKDKQIEELTRMLRQKQKLVEALKIQLEHGKIRGQVQDPVVLVRVKQEPPEKPSVPLSYGHPLFPPSPSCKIDFTKVTVKQEATETEDIMSETTLRSPVSDFQFLTPEVQRQILLQVKPEHTNTKSRKEEDICLQQTSVQLVQQQATEKLLLQKQHKIQNPQQTCQMQTKKQNLQKHSQQRKQKSHRQQKQQQSQQQHEQLKQQVPLKQQTSALKHQIKQQQLTKPQKIQIQINLKQQQVLIQKNPQMQQQSPQQVQCTPAKLVQLPEAGNQSRRVEFQTQQNTKDTEHEDDFIDTILQTGGLSTTSKLAPHLSLDCLYPNSPASSPPPSPFQLLQSPPSPPSCDSTHPALLVQSELERLVDTTEEKQHHSSVENGRLEDFLESTTGKPLLGVEPGGLLALIDDLHNQMLCCPSILDHPPSPTDTFDRLAEMQQGLNINDWLDLTMGGETDEEAPTLGPQTSCDIFSTEFLDSCLIL